MSTEVKVKELPSCDFCNDGTPALYDTKTTLGPWANTCQKHYDQYGIGELGTGRGQRLVLA